MEQLIELGGIDAAHRRLLADKPFFDHLDRDAKRRRSRALAHARLEHPELALLDGELNVAHIVEVVLEDLEDALEVVGGLLERRVFSEFLDRHRVADTRNDVLALGVHQEVTVAFTCAIGRVAREGDTRRRGLALVAVGHSLHVHRGTKVVGDAVRLAVNAGALVHPAAENGLDGELELDRWILREGDRAVLDELGMFFAGNVFAEDALELADELV